MTVADLDTNQDCLALRNRFFHSSVTLTRSECEDNAEGRGVDETSTLMLLTLHGLDKNRGKNTKMGPAPTGRLSLVKNCQKSLRQWPR